MEKSWNFEIGVKSHGKVMEFDKQIVNSLESAPLRDIFSKSNQHVCRYRGHGILRYGHGKVMEFCREDFVATLSREYIVTSYSITKQILTSRKKMLKTSYTQLQKKVYAFSFGG